MAASIEIKLAGQKIVLKAHEQDPDFVREVLEIVSVKIKNAEKRGKNYAPHQVALLALLDLAEDYVHSKRRTVSLKREMGDRSDALMRLLESELGV